MRMMKINKLIPRYKVKIFNFIHTFGMVVPQTIGC